MSDISSVTTSNGVTYTLKDSTARQSLVPSGGATGQVLTKTESGYGWEYISGLNYRSIGYIINPVLWDNNVYNIPMSGNIQSIADIVLLTYPSTMSESDYEMLRKADIRITGLTLSNLTIKALGEVPATSFNLLIVIIWRV